MKRVADNLKTSWKMKLALCALVLIPVLYAYADLTISISPGYQFTEGERPSVSTLNLLGTPSAQVTGTLGGTNVSLGANTVSGTMLFDSVAGFGLGWDGGSPRGLYISSEAAGDGLGGGDGEALSNKVDNVRIILANDAITLSVPTNTLVGGGESNLLSLGDGLTIADGTLLLTNFVSYEYPLSNGMSVNTNHSLGITPKIVNWVFVCKTNDAGYAPGDEVSVWSFYNDDSHRPTVSGGVNGTNVFMNAAYTAINVRRKDTGLDGGITATRWRAKCYARP